MSSSKTLDLSQRWAMAAAFMFMQQKLGHPQPILMMDRCPDVLFSTEGSRLVRVEFPGFTPGSGSYLVFVRLYRYDKAWVGEKAWYGGIMYVTHTSQPNFHQLCHFSIQTALDIPTVTLDEPLEVFNQVPVRALQPVTIGDDGENQWGSIEFVRQHTDACTIILLIRVNKTHEHAPLLKSAVTALFRHCAWNESGTQATISLGRISAWEEDEMRNYLMNHVINIENKIWPYIPEDED